MLALMFLPLAVEADRPLTLYVQKEREKMRLLRSASAPGTASSCSMHSSSQLASSRLAQGILTLDQYLKAVSVRQVKSKDIEYTVTTGSMLKQTTAVGSKMMSTA